MEQEKWSPFLRRLSMFSALFGLLFLSVFCFSHFHFRNHYHFVLGGNIETVVLGNSHPQCGINDEHLTRTKNLSRAGEPIYYVLPKLEHLLRYNQQLKRVILELSDKEFQASLADWMWSPMVIEHCTKAYWAFWPMDYHFGLIQKSGANYFNYLMAAQRKYLTAISQDSQPFFDFLLWGDYKPSNERMKKLEKNEANESTVENCDSLLLPDQDNVNALQQLIALCHQKKVELVFIRCPVHKSLHNCFEKDYFRWVSKELNLSVKDFRSLYLPDSCYRDPEHLNSTGATLFTQRLVKEGICR